MKYPKVSFIVKDARREAEYICFLAKSISDGNYQRGGFLVLPKAIKENYYTVYFPNLGYSKKFWSLIAASKNNHLGQPFPDEAVNEVLEKISPLESSKELAIKNKFITEWKRKENDFFKIYSDFIDVSNTLGKIVSIEVLLTPYGTKGSFYVTKENGKYKIYLTKRTDLPLDYLIRSILLSTISIKAGVSSEIGHLPWYYRHSLVDLLLTETVFNKLLTGKYIANKTSTKSASALVKNSNTYLKKLGFNYSELFKLNADGTIKVDSQNVDHVYTKQELEVLKTLINNKNHTVNFDRIASVIWGKNSLEKFSFYSMSKIIENIRRKTRGLGINKEAILTVRGRGYLLRD